MFTKSAAFYDAIYSFKDYAAEAARVHALIQQHKLTDGNTLLDVGCGTGVHAAHLKAHYAITGVDLDAGLLEVARQRLPGLALFQVDMRDFNLGEQFDIVTCLFGSIAYVQTIEAMRQTLTNLYRHAKPGGVVIVEPFISRENFTPGIVSLNTAESDGFKIARMGQIQGTGLQVTLTFHYLVGSAKGITSFTEDHHMALFTHQEYMDAIKFAGFDAVFDSEGLMQNRGLYLGVRRS